MQSPKLAMATVMRLFLVGLSIALAEDVPLLRGSNLTKPSNLTKAASSDAEDVMPSNLTRSAASGRIIGKDVLYDKIMGYWVPLSAFDTPSISFTTLNALLSTCRLPPSLLNAGSHFKVRHVVRLRLDNWSATSWGCHLNSSTTMSPCPSNQRRTTIWAVLAQPDCESIRMAVDEFHSA